jgi:hypothetical protein
MSVAKGTKIGPDRKGSKMGAIKRIAVFALPAGTHRAWMWGGSSVQSFSGWLSILEK